MNGTDQSQSFDLTLLRYGYHVSFYSTPCPYHDLPKLSIPWEHDTITAVASAEKHTTRSTLCFHAMRSIVLSSVVLAGIRICAHRHVHHIGDLPRLEMKCTRIVLVLHKTNKAYSVPTFVAYPCNGIFNPFLTRYCQDPPLMSCLEQIDHLSSASEQGKAESRRSSTFPRASRSTCFLDSSIGASGPLYCSRNHPALRLCI